MPIVDSISITEVHNFTIAGLTSTLNIQDVVVTVDYAFQANSLTSTSVVESANVELQQLITPAKITAGSAGVDNIVVQQLAHIKPNKLIATSRINPVPFNQVHILASDEILIGVPIEPSVRFLWDFQQINGKTWTEVSVINGTWTVVQTAA